MDLEQVFKQCNFFGSRSPSVSSSWFKGTFGDSLFGASETADPGELLSLSANCNADIILEMGRKPAWRDATIVS